jgi:hypothetical protein
MTNEPQPVEQDERFRFPGTLRAADTAAVRRARNLRRVLMVLLLAFLVAGFAGVFGVTEEVGSARDGGYVLEVTHPGTTRPGMSGQFEIEVTRDGGFDGPVSVATTAYFDIFQQGDIDPQPSESTASDDVLVWTFDPPDGDTLAVSIDLSTETNAAFESRDARTSVLVDGSPVVGVDYGTWVTH